jgi:APA family basic amino acid/polyamine antiporter
MSEPATLNLKRDLGVWSAVAIVVGSVIGSGIFLVPSTMIQKVGSPEVMYLVWIFGGLLSMAGALCYAELSAAMPEAGGGYVYLRETYGPLWGFIYAWTLTWVGKSGSAATLGTALFYYLAHFLPGLERELVTVPLPIGPGGQPLEITYGQLLAMAVILLLAGINYVGVRSGGIVQVVGTVAKVGLIGAIVVVALIWGDGSTEHYTTTIPAMGGLAGFMAALVAALWAYEGWADVSYVASEIKNPQRNLPRALIGGTLLIIAVYLVTNLAYFYVLSPSEIAGSDRVAATMMERVSGSTGAGLVSIAAMISIFAALNGTLLTVPRVPFAAAQDGLFFKAMGRVHPTHRTPSVSILVIGAWSALLVLSGRYENLFTYVVVATWLLYGMTAASVIVLRKKRPELPRPYRTLGYPVVPILFVVVAAGMLLSTLFASPRETLMGLTLVLGGLPFYFYWKAKGRRV